MRDALWNHLSEPRKGCADPHDACGVKNVPRKENKQSYFKNNFL